MWVLSFLTFPENMMVKDPGKIAEAYAGERKGVKEIRVVEGGRVEFPVFIFIYHAWQHEMTSVLKQNLASIQYTTEDICQWCIAHHIEYKVFKR